MRVRFLVVSVQLRGPFLVAPGAPSLFASTGVVALASAAKALSADGRLIVTFQTPLYTRLEIVRLRSGGKPQEVCIARYSGPYPRRSPILHRKVGYCPSRQTQCVVLCIFDTAQTHRLQGVDLQQGVVRYAPQAQKCELRQH